VFKESWKKVYLNVFKSTNSQVLVITYDAAAWIGHGPRMVYQVYTWKSRADVTCFLPKVIDTIDPIEVGHDMENGVELSLTDVLIGLNDAQHLEECLGFRWRASKVWRASQ
jgi:hypothetical protein